MKNSLVYFRARSSHRDTASQSETFLKKTAEIHGCKSPLAEHLKEIPQRSAHFSDARAELQDPADAELLFHSTVEIAGSEEVFNKKFEIYC